MSAAEHVWDSRRINAKDSPDFAALVGRVTDSSRAPDECARQFRALVGLDQTEPFLNLTRTLSRNGAMVGSLPEAAEDVSAYSCWYPGYPVVLVKSSPTGGRRVRFDTAHELGHLLLHRAVEPGRKAEAEADEFAGNLLLPSQMLRERIPSPFDWDAVERLATEYKVSNMAVVVRAHRVGILGSVLYRAVSVEASKRGWRSHQCDNMPTELFSQRGSRRSAA